MSDWMAIAQWQECERMARPGFVFELQNAEGLSLFTPCTRELPPTPFDWKSAPVRFRLVAAKPPQHSDPLPPPAKP